MEFDELKKIWDAQTNRPIYAIDETAMHNRILSKMNKGLRISNISEFLTIVVNLAGGLLILVMNLMKEVPNDFLYLLSAWMFVVSLYVVISRVRRLESAKAFDRTMHGDLSHGLAVANYQVRFSQLMRWNSLPIALLIVLAAAQSGRFLWVAIVSAAFILIANYVAGWEHNIYKSRRNELQALKDKLENAG